MQDQMLLYRPANAARMLDLSVRSIYRFIHEGRLQVVKVEGARGLRVHRSELERFAARPADTQDKE